MRQMRLTAEHVALVNRGILPDEGAPPGYAEPSTIEDHEATAHRLMEIGPPPDDMWFFAYGSLIWKPECTITEHRRATAHGWHRSFCMRLTRWRGTPDCPGLMMALDRGGRCDGVICRLPDDDQFKQLGLLLRREVDQRHDIGTFRWISVTIGTEKLRALTFYAAPRADYYTGKLPIDEVAKTLAQAAGHWGSCANYLYQTITKLEEYGIHDSGLWRLQEKVAQEIAALGH